MSRGGKANDIERYDNVDTALFRDDVDVNKAYQLIRWSIEGYQKDLENRLKGQKMTEIDLDPLWAEFYEYLAILKTILYKKGTNYGKRNH